MKISKRKLRTLIIEFLQPDKMKQEFTLSELPILINNISNVMIKNNKAIIEKMVNSLSEEDKSAIIEFKNLGIDQQIEAIKDSLSSKINESNHKDNSNILNNADQNQASHENMNLNSGNASLYDLTRGNHRGIKHVSQLEKLSDNEINALWLDVTNAKGFYNNFVLISLGLTGVLTMSLPIVIEQLTRSLTDTLILLGYINPSDISIPYYDFGNAGLILILLGIIFTAYIIVADEVKSKTIYKKNDRQTREKEIADALYLDDKEMPIPGSRQKATRDQNIKMMIKNIFRFFI